MSKTRTKSSGRQPAPSPPKRAHSPSTATSASDAKSPSKRVRVDTFGVISPNKIVPKVDPVQTVQTPTAGSDPTFSDEEDVEIAPTQADPDFSDVENCNEDSLEDPSAAVPASQTTETCRAGQGRMEISHLVDVYAPTQPIAPIIPSMTLRLREAVESSGDGDDKKDPEEDDGGSFVLMDTDGEATLSDSDTDKNVGAIAKLLSENPGLLQQFKAAIRKSSARPVTPDADGAATDLKHTDDPVAAAPQTPVNTAPVVTNVPGQPQAVLGPAFDTNAVFDGVKSCLNAALWPPGLRSMYRAIVPPPRVVEYKSMKADAYVDEADFSVWRGHSAAKRLVQALKFVSNAHYINICRVPYDQLTILDTQHIQYPMRYLTYGQKNEPALFVTLVEVRQSRLLQVHVIPKQDRSSSFDKKSLVAAPFSQELDLMVSTIGSVHDSNTVHMPSWSTVDGLRGFTFHTRIVPTRSGPVTRSSPTKRGNFNPAPAAVDNSNSFQVQLVGGQRVVVVDASETGFDFATPFSELKARKDMTDEPPAGSVGLVFYTISDRGSWTSIEFNVHGFVMLASAPVSA